MPAVSETQQRFMGMVHAYQKGELDMSNISASGKKKIRKAANEMSMKQTKDFAETKHKGLPEKVSSWHTSFKDELLKNAFRLPVAIESLSPTYANRIVNMASKSKHVGTIGKDLAALKEQLSLGEMARALGGTKEMKHRIAAHSLAKNIDATLRNLK